MLEGMVMVFAGVVLRHEPTVRWTLAFQVIPSIGHRIRATLEGAAVAAVVECVEHDTDRMHSIDVHPITLHCVQITEAATDVQNS